MFAEYASERTIKVGGAARFAVGHQREIGNIADFGPAETFVKPGAIAIGDCVEDEKCFAFGVGGVFGGAHEGSAKSLSAGAAMDEHLDQFSAVRLIFRKVEDQLNGPANALGIFSDDQGAFVF